MLTHIDLNRLRLFAFVFEQNSIVKAAEKLNITRSAVSQQLKKCEEEVGVNLFTRQHTNLVPTSEAVRLYRIVAPLLQEMERGIKEVRQGSTEPYGELRIGAPLEFGKNYLPDIIGSFRKQHRRVTFSLTLGDPERLMNMLRSGELDFALVDLFLTDNLSLAQSPVFATRPVVEEEIVMICSGRYFEQKMEGQADLSRLLQLEYITYQQNNLVLNTWFRQHFRKNSPHLSIVLTVDNVRAVVVAVQHHIGLGIVPYHVVQREVEEGRIVVVSSGKRNIVNIISLLQLQEKVPSLAEKQFVSHLYDRVASDLSHFSMR